MKAVLEHIEPRRSTSVLFREISKPNFETPFHYHPELELTYIEKGRGVRHVGMKMEEFEEGDLVFLGANLPHCWLNRPDEDGSFVSSYVIQFHEDVFSESFLKLPEFSVLKALFSMANLGVKFKGQNFGQEMKSIFKKDESQRIIALLQLFLKLANAEKSILLDVAPVGKSNPDRFHLVFSYIIEHFREQISLENVAEIAGLTTTSFCRYFKNITGKTFFEVILEYRIEAVVQLLVTSNKRINEIAFETGFQDIPYFNRSFKKQIGMSPSQFREIRNTRIPAV
ncbi:AraC family transcriptional regulator [Arcticibacterium luteifluviistationis]|uniref:AraC family transcriptional regulator n=1 Tax=Arcticibacterium luteifluviistationis TaxID=1784714 RepID=A0A2Z4G6H5_9BACT|nr:AraC family transcriptional regulator [Arcticibacterium luteifluviistationis]AWV96747.1 AraC family transcriptional regulator [Arcticibacterium luteifluviistationis]